jgi:Replication-relaxation
MLTTTLTLTPRDIDMVFDTGIFKYLSIFQLQALHFPNAKHYRTATNRVGSLVSAGLISRVFHHPKVTATTGRPASILYLQPENLRNLAALLAAQGKASLFDRFADITPTPREEFAYSFITHELAISDVYIALARSARPDSLVFWERLSPKAEGVSTKIRATITTDDGEGSQLLSFNPDAFLCYKTVYDSLAFFFHEHDNNTETNLFRLYRKYAAYLAYRKAHRFPDVLRRFLAKHGISLPDELIDQADFKVLTTTPTHDRRDKLLREVNRLDDSSIFYFAANSDITPEAVHSPILYNASDYNTIAEAERALPKETKPSVRARFIQERMLTLPTYSLDD